MASSQTSTQHPAPRSTKFFSPGAAFFPSLHCPYEYRPPGSWRWPKPSSGAPLTEAGDTPHRRGRQRQPARPSAYLLPANCRTGQRVIVSTGTKALQDQLFFRRRAVPRISTGESAGLLHGKGRCQLPLAATQRARRPARSAHLVGNWKRSTSIRQIAEWEKDQPKNRRPLPSFSEFARIERSAGTSSDAPPATGLFFGNHVSRFTARCFIHEMRRTAPLESDIIIVNHQPVSSLTSPSSSRHPAPPDAGILPERPPQSSSTRPTNSKTSPRSYFGLSRQQHPFRRNSPATHRRTTFTPCQAPAPKEWPAGHPAATRSRTNVSSPACPPNGERAASPFDNREEFLETTSGDLYLSPAQPRFRPSRIGKWTCLNRHRRGLPGLRKALSPRLRTELEFLLESNSSNMVYLARRKRRIQGRPANNESRHFARPRRVFQIAIAGIPSCKPTPIDVSELLHELVFEKTIPTAILTSGNPHRAGRLRTHPASASA